MALFPNICVLRGFSAAAYREVAFLSCFAGTENPCASPREMRSIFNWGGLDPDKNSSFMNRKRTVPMLKL